MNREPASRPLHALKVTPRPGRDYKIDIMTGFLGQFDRQQHVIFASLSLTQYLLLQISIIALNQMSSGASCTS